VPDASVDEMARDTTGRIMIYGATGYTGTLIAEHAAARGLDVTIGGRDPDKVHTLAERLGTPSAVFEATDVEAATAALRPFDVLLNVAGPFRITAEPLMLAAVQSRTHYLDTTAEFPTYALAESMDASAKQAGVMMMSGVGWDVVPTDSLALHTARRVTDPVHLALAIRVTGGFSRGSLSSAATIEATGPLTRQAGTLRDASKAKPRWFDVGSGDEEYTLASMGDLVTAQHSTGIDDIEVYLRTDSGFPDLDESASGPSAEERAQGRYGAVAEVRGRDGQIARSRIDTPSGYNFTQLSSVEIAARTAAGTFSPGFQSPASVHGPTLATSIADTTITDL
jgi:short subunit dehydrogenase-like uncharacterized protein